ncbi:MAG: hypothetical protein ACREQX_09635 [Candidatus Binataceae bacterium]
MGFGTARFAAFTSSREPAQFEGTPRQSDADERQPHDAAGYT